MKCKGIYYQYVPKWDVYIGAPPKCGSSSLHHALEASNLKYDSVRAAKIPDGSNVVFIVRHALDRFKSLWRFRCVPGGDNNYGTGRALHGKSPAQLWMHMRGHPNKHWARQDDLLEGLVERCTVAYVRLDDLTSWWNSRSKTPMPCVNRTHGRVPTTYALEQSLRKYYADDLQLYAEAKP